MKPGRNRTNHLAMILAIVIAVVFVAFFGINTIRIRVENEELAKLESALKESYENEQERAAALESELERELTPEEKIELARHRFGLVFPNEILFLPNDD